MEIAGVDDNPNAAVSFIVLPMSDPKPCVSTGQRWSRWDWLIEFNAPNFNRNFGNVETFEHDKEKRDTYHDYQPNWDSKMLHVLPPSCGSGRRHAGPADSWYRS